MAEQDRQRQDRLRYDVFGNLRAVSLPDGTKIEYLIDAANRRVGKKLNGKLVQGLLYQDQLKPIAELDGDGKLVSRFIYGTRVNVPEYMEKAGNTYRIITDHLGSPRLVIDRASGVVAQLARLRRVRHRVYHSTRALASSRSVLPAAYTIPKPHSHALGPGTIMRTRVAGRPRIPLGFAGGEANLYVYSGNDPINWTDATGLDCGGPSVWMALGSC